MQNSQCNTSRSCRSDCVARMNTRQQLTHDRRHSFQLELEELRNDESAVKNKTDKKEAVLNSIPSCLASVGGFLLRETDVGSGCGGWGSEVGLPEEGWDTERKREAAGERGGVGVGVGGWRSLTEIERGRASDPHSEHRFPAPSSKGRMS